MSDNPSTTGRRAGGRGGYLFLFLLFGTAGMGALGLGVLARPLAVYWHDQRILQAQRDRIEKLKELHDQQQELLDRADQPDVVERAAIRHFRYQPSEGNVGTPDPLPPVWESLRQALGEVEKESVVVQEENVFFDFVEELSEKTGALYALMGLGAGLVVVSLSCFWGWSGRGAMPGR